MKTTKIKKKVKRKQGNIITKITTKKFQLESKYAKYPIWDEKQNPPSFILDNIIMTNHFKGWLSEEHKDTFDV